MSEKLTIISSLTIRQTETMARDIQSLADLRGMEKSEYIRHLVAQDKLEQHRLWLARNPLFANEPETATVTPHDNVGHECKHGLAKSQCSPLDEDCRKCLS